jgi:fumarate hydratase subunit beta
MAAIRLKIPLGDKSIKKLEVGDLVELSGNVFCARDMAHQYYYNNLDKEIRPNLDNSVIYHCGPLVKNTESGYKIISAGPTTSIRMSLYLTALIEKYHLKAIIGKGGLDKSMLKELNKFSTVYLSVTGGSGALIANTIKKVEEVFFLDKFGPTEAVWKLYVESLPAIVTMDTHFHSLHEEVLEKSFKMAGELI